METKNCQNCKKDFIIEPDDFGFYEKIKVPPPTFCPECRLQRRMTFRNERTLYKRKCDICKKDIISLYPEGSLFPVYCNPCWYRDKWNPENYGLDFDFSVPFFSQFKKLLETVPRPALIGNNNVNSPYVNYSANHKNCYLVNCSDTCENCAYCDRTFRTKESFDCFGVVDSEFCYETNQGTKNYRVGFADNSMNSIDSVYIKNCKNVLECLGCINLFNKSNFLLNKKISKEEFVSLKEKIGSYPELKKLKENFLDLYTRVPHRFANNVLCINSDGNELFETRNCHNSFYVRNSENLKYAYFCSNVKDSHDFNFADNAELIYESANIEQNFLKLFSTTCWYTNNVTYSDLCVSSSDIFGSVCLKDKKYCILNKSYSKEEYEILKSKIIEQMDALPFKDKKGRIYKYGEFFPPEISPFAYNESIAQDHFPLHKEDAVKKGYSWKDSETRNYKITKYTADLPDHINEVEETITEDVIECGHKGECNHQCTEVFRIIPKEIQFYKQMNLPLPRFCPNCRYHIRLEERNPVQLWSRKCDCIGNKSRNGLYENTAVHSHGNGECAVEFKTSYSPDRPEIIYCKECYQAEVS
ncbi:MAG: hypothetical protein WCS86_00995 [Candidatus Paceibacterota bacterium]